MGLFDSIKFENENNFLQRFSKKIVGVEQSKIWFQTKSLTSSMLTYTINNNNQFMLNDIFLKGFSGTFEVYAYEDEYWIQLFLTIEDGMMTKQQIEYIRYWGKSSSPEFKFQFQTLSQNENIPSSSFVYLRRMIEKNEKN